ncbi:MAG: DUF4142 domain-containing protein [Bdellovibrionales bacterium]|nr:DUF4142 domain-containing protein [Bdellovibrionales bacterium]
MQNRMKSWIALTTLAFLAGGAFAAEMADKPAATPPNDAEIAQIVLTADNGEIDAAKLAKKRTKNADVKAFAEMMIDQHRAVTKDTKQLAKKIKLKPRESAASRDLKESSKTADKALKEKKGADFDRAYVDQMVADHQAVLDTIDNQLLPNAQNAELKALLTKVRPAVAEHLEHAKELQAKLGEPNAG